MRVKLHIPFLVISVNLLLNFKFSLQDVRLPTHLTPEAYTLEIFSELYSDPPKFWGDVRITVICNADTKMITLHKKDLDIFQERVEVNLVGSKSKYIVSSPYYDPESNQYTMLLHTDLLKGNRYEIFIPFQGTFSMDLTGYFLIIRTNQYGSSFQKRMFATTHLGISEARRVFPCFDEMEMKAKFTVFLAHPESMISFSNMEKDGYEKTTVSGIWIVDRFAESPPIPPSAVVITLIPADFEEKNLNLDSNTPLRIWAAKSDIHLPRFETETVIKAFSYYSDYLTVPFAFPKLNVVKYDTLNMSREYMYGLIIVGKSCMIDTSNPSDPLIGYSQFQNTLDICHLMSHQWIDFYTIMSRRNENWLYEALTLHFDVLCVNKVSPMWKNTFSDIHIVSSFLFALKNDQEGLTDNLLMAENDSKMEGNDQEVLTDKLLMVENDSKMAANDQEGSTDELLMAENDSKMAAKMIDSGHLRKAQFLIRMLSFVVDENVFQLSINNYLEEFESHDFNLDKLWSTFSVTARESQVQLEGLTIKKLMNSWFTQKGLPLITVKVEREKNRVQIEQKRFKLLDELSKKSYKPSSDSECWNIPLSYMKKGDLESETDVVRKWLRCDGPVTIDITLDQDEWILVNLNLNVLSRTSYDSENWDLLRKTLNSEEYKIINVMNRVKLISDAFELSKIELLSYKMLFDIISYLNYEENFLPWKIASTELENIRTQLFGTEVLGLYEAYIRTILKTAFQRIYSERIDFRKGDYLNNKFKRTIIQLSCNFGFDSCQHMCSLYFNDWVESIHPKVNNHIPHLLRDIVYCHGITAGSDKEWTFLWNQYNKELSDIENDVILDALGCSTHSQTLENYLKWSLDKKKVSPSNSFKVFLSLSKSKIGYKLMNDFFTKNLGKIYKFTNEEGLLFDSYFITLFDLTMKEDDKNKILKLAVDYQKKLEDFDKIFNHHVNVATRNVLWLKKYESVLSDLLKK